MDNEEKKYNQIVTEKIKKNIALLRKENKLTMRAAAAGLGVKENTYRVWEDPTKGGPKAYHILQIAKAYGVSTDFIYSNEDNFVPSFYSKFQLNSPERDKGYVYGEEYLSELDNKEKVIIMQIRRLNTRDKERAYQAIANIIKGVEDME